MRLPGKGRVAWVTGSGKGIGRAVALALAALLGQKVDFVPDCVGSLAEEAIVSLQSGQVLLLENLKKKKRMCFIYILHFLLIEKKMF